MGQVVSVRTHRFSCSKQVAKWLTSRTFVSTLDPNTFTRGLLCVFVNDARDMVNETEMAIVIAGCTLKVIIVVFSPQDDSVSRQIHGSDNVVYGLRVGYSEPFLGAL